ncbi:MAG: hypothetical protein WBN92_15420 [Terriglobia bacterium]
MPTTTKRRPSVNSVVRLVTRKNPKARKDVKTLLKEVYRTLGLRTVDQIFAIDAPSPETILRERRKIFE